MKSDEVIQKLKEWRQSPIAFVEAMWGLVPQPLVCSVDTPGHEHGVKCYGEFIKGKHLAWQQMKIFEAVERAIKNEAQKRISVASGHGTGKSSAISMLIFWFLFTRKDAQIGCTAPSSSQLFDVLWRALEEWRKRMPEKIAKMFIWQTSYLRVAESPETWFARARTGRKETPEAFSGIHSNHVMLVADEASAVPDEIYRSAEGSMTSKDVLVILISNPTRLEGYFYDTHNKDKDRWQRLQFSSLESPVVEPEFEENIASKYGRDSNEFRFMVEGVFPSAEGMLEGGWMPLFEKRDIDNQIRDLGPMLDPVYMGVDPSGMGSNKTCWAARDMVKAKILASELKSNTVGIAERTVTLAEHYAVKPINIRIDSFGVGCVDNQTEILTKEKGFILFENLMGDESVLSLDIKSGLATWQKIKKIYKYKYKGFLNQFKNQCYDFVFTDDHKFPSKKWEGQKQWKVEPFGVFAKRFLIKSGCRWIGKPFKIEFNHEWKIYHGGLNKRKFVFDSKDWAEFVGWFVSEGSVYEDKKRGYYHINIAQKNSRKRLEIKNLLNKMGLKFKDDGRGFTMCNFMIGRHLLAECGKYAKNKRIPFYIKNATPELISAFLDSYYKGDGWINKYNRPAASSTSQLLMDDLQECLIKIGSMSRIKLAHRKNSIFLIENRKVKRKNDTFVIYHKKQREAVYISRKFIKKILYDDYVYCIETEPYHTMLIRRGGVVMWSGNSDVSQEIALGTQERVLPVNVGGKPVDERFINVRAEMYWRMREWLRKGGQLVYHSCWKQLLIIYYKRTLSGKIQIMSKEEMIRRGWDSPDELDATALTFVGAGAGRDGLVGGSGRGAVQQLSGEEVAKIVNVYGY